MSKSSNKTKLKAGVRPAAKKLSGHWEKSDTTTLQDQFIVRFNKVDCDGPWCLSKISPGDHVGLLKSIKSLESMTVGEAFQGGHPGKDYRISDLPNKHARQRLAELNLEAVTNISRLRVNGEQRLYGVRRGSCFHVLWWDPKHEIWPSKLKHT